MKLIMTKGLPASGKTTWAKEYVLDHPGSVRVNKDELRQMLHAGKWSKQNEQTIIAYRDQIVGTALSAGKTIIVDDTNLAPKHEETLRRIASAYNAEFEIKDFTEVSLEECIARDQKRANYVGEKVIKDMYNKYLKPKPPVIEYNELLQDVIICDLDGTLCLFGDANPYDRNFSEDVPNHPVQQVLDKVDKIVFLSGRSSKYFDVTRKWLDKQGFKKHPLFMRDEGDNRKDAIIKRELYDQHIKEKYNVNFVLDDRNQVVDLWRSLGLTCFQVADGDF